MKAVQESIKETTGTIPTIHEEEHEQDGDQRHNTIITSILKKDSQIKDSDKKSNITLSKDSSYRNENAEMEPMTQRASGRHSNEMPVQKNTNNRMKVNINNQAIVEESDQGYHAMM